MDYDDHWDEDLYYTEEPKLTQQEENEIILEAVREARENGGFLPAWMWEEAEKLEKSKQV